jgi:hypothetical protein
LGDCSWDHAGDPRVPGLLTTYTAGFLGDFGPDWVNAIPPGALVTSLDLEEGAAAFAASVLRTTQIGTFTPVLGSAAPDQLPAVASAEGAQGRVLTAVSFQGGLVTYLSYAWSEALAARFETQVMTATIANAGTAAADLAAQGYVITALGAGNLGANGVVLVGTRREGDTAPRALQVQSIAGYYTSPPGYVPVGYFFDDAALAFTMIFER